MVMIIIFNCGVNKQNQTKQFRLICERSLKDIYGSWIYTVNVLKNNWSISILNDNDYHCFDIMIINIVLDPFFFFYLKRCLILNGDTKQQEGDSLSLHKKRVSTPIKGTF